MADEVRETLVVASCFGAQFETQYLQAVAPRSIAFLDATLSVLCDAGLIESSKPDVWRFQHDQVQQRAYGLIPENERDSRHLRIGRLLWAEYNKRPDGEVDLGTVILQLQLGARHLTDQAERDRVASLLLHAGEQASASSSFVAAASYLDLAMDLLGSRHWKDEYFLSLNVYNAAAEIQYCIGNFSRALELIDVVLVNARNEDDKSRALTLQIYTLGSEHKLQEAIDLSVDVLWKGGVHLPRYLLIPRMLASYYSMKRRLNTLSNSDILNLPLMTEATALSNMNVLALLIESAATGRNSLAPFVAFRLIDMTLEKGLTSASAMGFSTLSALMSITFGEIDSSKRFAQLSRAIVDRFDNKKWLPRVALAVHGYSFTWDQPPRLQLKPLLAAHRLALGNGDIQYAVVTASMYSNLALHSSADLRQLRGDTQIFVQLAEIHNQQSAKVLIVLNLQFMINLMDNPSSPSTMDGEYMTEEGFIKQAVESNNATQKDFYQLCKIHLHSVFHEYAAGCEAMIRVEKGRRRTYTPVHSCRHFLHAGLCCAMTPKHRKRATRHLRDIRKMADRNEQYARNKALLLAAVLDAVNGKPVFSKFDESIDLARAELLWNEAGLACEHAAKLALRLGQTSHASVYAKQALEAYEKWGAHTKCVLVKKEFDL